jgi:hypothetical protein
MLARVYTPAIISKLFPTKVFLLIGQASLVLAGIIIV